MLHTFTKVYKFDTLLLLVRLAVLAAVTLTVPIVLFPVSSSEICLVCKPTSVFHGASESIVPWPWFLFLFFVSCHLDQEERGVHLGAAPALSFSVENCTRGASETASPL